MAAPRKSQSQSVHRPSSVAETEENYDPFRPSRAQIAKEEAAEYARITVLREASEGSSRRRSARISSRASARNPAITRAQEVGDVYSIASSPPTTTMHSAGPSQLQRMMVKRGISSGNSKLTMNSKRSANSNSSAVMARKSSSYKRNVSFVHNRKRSFSGRHPRLRSQEHHTSPFTLQERFFRDQAQAKAHPVSASPSVSVEETPQPEQQPTVRSRKSPVKNAEDHAAKKAKMASHYWRDDARKVSVEMEKLCDDAFNRSPIASSIPTPRTEVTDNRYSQQTSAAYSSPATSISMHEDPIPMSVTHHVKAKEIHVNYQQRPLPKPPATERHMDSEHLGSYTQRELAKTRDLLKKRAAESTLSPGYLDEVIAHLDRLMQPSALRLRDEERRAVSTPDQITGIPRKDTFEQIMEKGNIGFRSTSAPHNRKTSEQGEQTLRLVDSSSGLKPISPIKPLTIRKKSESSTPSAGSPRQITPTQQLFTTEELYRAQERRSANPALLDGPSLDPIDEDEDKENFDPATRKTSFPEARKRRWFRRHQPAPAYASQGPPLPVKDQRPLAGGQSLDLQAYNRECNIPGEDYPYTDTKKSSAFGKGRFFKIFANRRDFKESQKSAGGDYDLGDGESLATEDSTFNYNPQQGYVSGALQNASHSSVLKRNGKGRTHNVDDILMPPPPVSRVIVPQHQNWLARFLRIKPAVSVICFQVSKVRARKEVISVFRDWRKYGMRDIVVDKEAGRIWAKVDVKNCTYPIFFLCIFSVLAFSTRVSLVSLSAILPCLYHRYLIMAR